MEVLLTQYKFYGIAEPNYRGLGESYFQVHNLCTN